MNYLFQLSLLLFSSMLWAQSDSIQLLQPTGSYQVGTIRYEWTDQSRSMQMDSQQVDRTIAVQIWYPASVEEATSTKASYFPTTKDGAPFIQTNSYANAPFNKHIDSCHLILIAPGRGTASYRYTSMIEELASHGYLIAAVDMPELGYVQYQNGTRIKADARFKPPKDLMSGPYEQVDQFFEEATALGYQDLAFAFQQIKALNQDDPEGRFTHKIRLEDMGIFGHSLGGRIAGEFAHRQTAVKALIAMEGIPPRAIRYEGKLRIPVAMLCGSRTWPYAKENYFSLIDNRTHPVYMIELLGFGHNALTDQAFIYAKGSILQENAATQLSTGRSLLVNYFQSIFEGKDFEKSIQGIDQVKVNAYK